jgi:hypothetical protein
MSSILNRVAGFSIGAGLVGAALNESLYNGAFSFSFVAFHSSE